MKPVWEKGQGSHTKRHGIKQEIKRIHSEIDEEVNSQPKEIGLIEAADNALKNRVVQRDQMQKFIEKKREMFLMQMTIDQKKEQIKQLEQTISIKTKGLEKAEMSIKKDLEHFNKHLATKKKQAQLLNEKASFIANEKTGHSKQLKKNKDQKATEISGNTKELETLDKLLRYKNFLDKLADSSNVSQPYQDDLKEIEANPALKEIYLEYKKFYPQSLLSAAMLKLILDPTDLYKPSFEATEDIKKKFIDMEEQNLKLIGSNQEAENEKDDLSQKLKDMTNRYNEDITNLQAKKRELIRKIDEKKSRIAELERVKIGGFQQIEVGDETLDQKIESVCKVMDVPKKLQPIDLMTVGSCESGTRAVDLAEDREHSSAGRRDQEALHRAGQDRPQGAQGRRRPAGGRAQDEGDERERQAEEVARQEGAQGYVQVADPAARGRRPGQLWR